MRLIFSIVVFLFTFSSFSQEKNFLATIKNTQAVSKLTDEFPEVKVEIAFPESRKELFKSVYRIISSAEQSDSVLTYLQNNKSIKEVEVEEKIETLQAPNDYYLTFGNDYALNLINAIDAWDITTGDSNITIGISDANFDLNHEELIGEYTTNVNNFFHSNINHGTAVAITASGKTNNTTGKSAIGYNTKMKLEYMSYNGLLNLSYAGVKVINASWASGCFYSGYHQQIINEIYENGTIIVAAAGNGSTCYGPESLVYPAAYEHVISVSSIGPNDNHERIPGDVHSTHQHNDSVDIVAPGYDVAIGIANNNYTTGNGTSFAAPYVSGTIALMLSVNPCLTYEDVQSILKETAVDIYPVNSIYTGLLGAGRLDAAAAVEMAKDYASFNFDVSSEYDCVNDQYLLNIEPQETDYSTSIEWENGNTNWTLYDQIEGQYNFTIHRAFGCDIDTFVYYIPNQPVYDYTNSVELNYGHTTLHDFNGDGVIRIKGLLIVESNVTYNLSNKNIEFGYNKDLPNDIGFQESGIVVKPGGKLTIDNCTLNSVEDCNSEWDGIELWGVFKDTAIVSSNLNQTKSTANVTTEVTMLNSTLSNATTGIRNHREKQVFGSTAGQKEICGKITVINSVFENNKTGINLKENHNNNHSHSISNSEFNAGNQSESTHIKLSEINNIEIIKTKFTGKSSEQVTNSGIGIYAENSSINPDKAVAQIPQKTNNEFKDLYEGIYLINSESDNYLFVGNELFTNVQRGIYLSGNIHSVIAQSTFNLSAGSAYENSFALMTSNTEQLKVVNNIINGSTVNESTHGFVTKNNNESEVHFIGNDFFGDMETAIQFEGSNHNVDVSCNTFDIIGNYDLAIAEGSIYIDKSFVLNSFSKCENVTANIVNDSNNSPFTYTTASNSTPNCISAGVSIAVIETPENWQSSCEFKGNIARINPNSTFNYEDQNSNKETSSIMNINYLTTTSQISETKSTNEMTVFPNPTRGNFTIKTEGLTIGKEIIIYNQMGGVAKRYELTSEVNSFEIKGLGKGAYTIYTMGENNTPLYGKVVIQ